MAPKPETQFIRACSTGKPEVVRELLEGGLSPETRDNYGLTGLIWAGRKGQVGVAEILLLAVLTQRQRIEVDEQLCTMPSHSITQTSLGSSLSTARA